MPERHIYLTGFSGSGKSTVGPLLARLLKYRFVDTDSLIEARTGKSIGELFSMKGEVYFRRLESAVIREWAALDSPAVIAVGGGAITREINRDLMKRSGVVVYLRCSQRELYRRLVGVANRPLLGGQTETVAQERKDKIQHLLKERRPLYEQAHLTIPVTNLSPRQAALCILRALKEKAWQQ